MEMIIVIAIIGLIASVSWRSLSEGKKRNEVGNVCKVVASMINKTRSYALTGKQVRSGSPSSFIFRLNNEVIIEGTGENGNEELDRFIELRGVSCGQVRLSYTPPNGRLISASGLNGGEIICSLNGDYPKTIQVSKYRAICENN